MIEISDKRKCCGCTACYSICPKNAIEMVSDDEGFKYPKINMEKCVDCGMCDRICPEINPSERNKELKTYKYAVQNLSEEERRQSTAGGFFSVIADYVIEVHKGSVFAVGYEEMIVAHKEAKCIEELEEMRGSKYVQSNMGEIFKAVKQTINEDKKCLFVGTPCQVNGIEKYLANDIKRENLITVDLLCLGVSSPMLFQQWRAYLQTKYKDKVKTIYFRDKSYGYATANVKVCFENRKYLEQCYDAKSLMKTFFAGYNMRPSCYECTFRCISRVSDFTIGDFHQVAKYSSSMDDDKGTTCVWAHSEKAKHLMDELNNKMNNKLIEEECSNILGDKVKLVEMPKDRREFFEDANVFNYQMLCTKWAKNDMKGRIINLARKIINKLPFKSFVF